MPSSSSSFASTVDLSLRPSMRALRMAFGIHLLCFALLLAAQPPAPALLALAAVFAASWIWARRHPALGFGPRAVVRLLGHAQGGWTLHRAQGSQLEAELLDDSIVRGVCLVLRFKIQSGETVTRMICGDELSAESLRRLRARLSAV